MSPLSSTVLLACHALAAAAPSGQATEPAPLSTPGVAAAQLRTASTTFEANRGQFPAEHLFRVRHADLQIAFGERRVTHVPAEGGTPLTLEFLGAADSVEVRGLDQLRARSNYLVGARPDDFVTGVPHFGSLRYEGLYQGVDLEWTLVDGRLKYTFYLAPGADPRGLKLAYRNAEGLEVSAQGELVIHTARGVVQEEAPIAYQVGPDGRQPVSCAFSLDSSTSGGFGFQVGDHDPALPLVIDPFLDFSTYFGGNQYDAIYAVDVDQFGDIYVAGKTSAPDFPATDGSSYGGGNPFDAFAAKFSAAGDLIYATYLGGSDDDEAWGIAVAPDGRAVVAGFSDGWLPFVDKGAAIQDQAGGGLDAFALKLSATGDVVDWATYIGGSGSDRAWHVDVDPLGNAYVAGGTGSEDFPLANADQTSLAHDPAVAHASSDAFLTKIDAEGTAFVYSTYVGSSGFDQCYAVAVDDLGRAYVAGGCGFSDIGPTPGAADTVFSGAGVYGEGFVVRYAPNDGSSVLQREYLTLIGGTSGPGDAEYPVAVAVGPDYSCYVTGLTSAPDFPGVAGHYDETLEGTWDGFVARIAPDGQSFLFATYLGGPDGTDPGLDPADNSFEYPWGLALDEEQCVWLTGFTASSFFPTVEAGDVTYNGQIDAFVSALSPDGNQLMFSTYLGGGAQDIGYAIAADGAGGIVVGGITHWDELESFPIHDAYDPSHNSHGPDGFLTRFRREPAVFIRGDTNADGMVNIADAIMTLEYVTGRLSDNDAINLDAADVDDTGHLDLSDGIYLFNYFFSGGPAPAQPFPTPGVDPTPDALGSFVTN